MKTSEKSSKTRWKKIGRENLNLNIEQLFFKFFSFLYFNSFGRSSRERLEKCFFLAHIFRTPGISAIHFSNIFRVLIDKAGGRMRME